MLPNLVTLTLSVVAEHFILLEEATATGECLQHPLGVKTAFTWKCVLSQEKEKLVLMWFIWSEWKGSNKNRITHFFHHYGMTNIWLMIHLCRVSDDTESN